MADIKAPALNPSLVKQTEFIRNLWSVTIPHGVPLSSVLDPDFWAHCTKTMKEFDKIECRAQDNAWYAELLVSKVEKQAAHVWVLFHADLSAQTGKQQAEDDYAVAFGGAHKWRVIRKSDKAVIHHGEPSEDAARSWLKRHVESA